MHHISHSLFLRCFCPIVISLLLGESSFAGTYDNPPAVPGFTHEEELSVDTPELQGIILEGRPVLFSSPVVAEVDGDSSNGKEVVVAGGDGLVYVYKSDGSLLWSAKTPNYNCRGTSSDNKLYSGPAVGELFGDGKPYVVIGYGGVTSGTSCDGGVVAFRGSTGKKRWDFSLRKFSRKERFYAFSYSVFSSPAIADVDGDGKLEIGFGAFDRNIYLLNADGSVRWYYNAADTVWSSPAFMNVDDDPDLEMIIGSDISGNSVINPPTKDGGYLYAFKTAKRKNKHIYFRSSDAFVWMTTFNQVLYSSPVIADVLPSNDGPEILIGSGCFFPQDSNDKRGQWVKIVRPSDGKVLQTLNATTCIPSSVAVGDLDDDGLNEVVATVSGDESQGGDGSSRILAWSPTISSDPIWNTIPRDRSVNDPYGGFFISPVIADLDGNGSLEVIVNTYGTVGVFNGRDGSALTCQARGCGDDLVTLLAWKPMRGSPAVADINGDGILDIFAAGGHSGASKYGALYGWTYFSGLLASPVGAQPAYSAPWPMWRGNPQHTGLQGE